MNNVHTVNGPHEFALERIANRVHVANVKWWTDLETGHYPIQRNVGELLMLSVSELSEAMEGHRKNLPDDKLPQYKMFDVEIVDAFIRLFDIAGAMIPNFGEIFEAKMTYNASRADHSIEHRKSEHGKKY